MQGQRLKAIERMLSIQSRIRKLAEWRQKAIELQAAAARAQHEQAEGGEASAHAPGFVENDPTTWGNPSRNDPCPCGSGERFKNCHGRLV